MSRSLTVDFIFIFSFHFILFFLFLFHLFYIFRTTQVRVYQSQVDGQVTRLIMGLRRIE